MNRTPLSKDMIFIWDGKKALERKSLASIVKQSFDQIFSLARSEFTHELLKFLFSFSYLSFRPRKKRRLKIILPFYWSNVTQTVTRGAPFHGAVQKGLNRWGHQIERCSFGGHANSKEVKTNWKEPFGGGNKTTLPGWVSEASSFLLFSVIFFYEFSLASQVKTKQNKIWVLGLPFF